MGFKTALIFIISCFFLITQISCSETEAIEEESSTLDCIDTNCANYTSQAAAQAAFDADPECKNDLDQDKDGIACEESGNSVKNCATTSNCGCSNKSKAACQRDPCCRWIVGTGCKCN